MRLISLSLLEGLHQFDFFKDRVGQLPIQVAPMALGSLAYHHLMQPMMLAGSLQGFLSQASLPQSLRPTEQRLPSPPDDSPAPQFPLCY